MAARTYLILFLALLCIGSVQAFNVTVIFNYSLSSTTDNGPNGLTLDNHGAAFTGGGAQFNGTTYMNRTNRSDLIGIGTNSTVMCAFQKATSSSSGSIICLANGANDRFCVDISNSQGLRGGIYNGATYANRGSFPNSLFADTNWHWFAYVHNTSMTDPMFYLDGALSSATNTPATGGGSRWVFGSRDDLVSNNLSGIVGNCLAVAEVLNQDQVEYLGSSMVKENAVITITDTNISGNAPLWGFNPKNFGGNNSHVDIDGDGTRETVSDYLTHRTMMEAAGTHTLRIDMCLDHATGVNTFENNTGNKCDISIAKSQLEWAHSHRWKVEFLASYMPPYLALVDSTCTGNTTHCTASNYTTWGTMVSNWLYGVSGGNSTLLEDTTVGAWNEPYLNQFFLPSATYVERVAAYQLIYNATRSAVKASYPSMPVCLETIYIVSSDGLNFATGSLGNMSPSYVDCVAFHEYGESTLYSLIEAEIAFIEARGYGANMMLTEVNDADPRIQVNSSYAAGAYLADALLRMRLYHPNVTAAFVYQWSDPTLYANSGSFENWARDYRTFSESQLDNKTFYPYNVIKQLGNYHAYGVVTVNSTSNQTDAVSIASKQDANYLAVTVLSRGIGKNITLNFTNASYITVQDMTSLATYNITNGLANVTSLNGENFTTFLAFAPSVTTSCGSTYLGKPAIVNNLGQAVYLINQSCVLNGTAASGYKICGSNGVCV